MRIIQRMAVGALQRRLPLEADGLMATALRVAGRQRFADETFRGALERLLEALEAQAHLGVFGHLAARFDLLRRALGDATCAQVAQPGKAHAYRPEKGAPSA